MSNRQPRRQGVVYGPVRPPGSGRNTGAILGRILGLLVIVLAVGVLGGGAIAFISGRPPASAPRSPSPIAFLSLPPSEPPDATPSLATASPVPTPPVTESPSPSAPATPFVPQVQVGPGFVTFGRRANNDLRITEPQAILPINQRLTWSAHLIEPVDTATTLTIRVLKLDPEAEGGEQLVIEDEVTPSVSDAQIFQRRMRPRRALDGPGIYVVRYLRGDTLMAEGYVQLEE